MSYLLENAKTAQVQYNEIRRYGNTPSGTCVLHTAENVTDTIGADTGAENVYGYVKTRTDYGSYHRIVDSDSRLVLALWEHETFHCRKTNPWSVGISAAVRSADWNKLYAMPYGDYPSRGHAIIDNMAIEAANFVVYMLTKHGVTVPIKRITGDEAKAKKPGFCGHVDTDSSRRSDPGKDFNWDYFFVRVQTHIDDGSYSLADEPKPKPTPKPEPKPEPKPTPKPESKPKPEENTLSITMANPAEGRVSSEYGWRAALSKTIPAMLHAGIDIANKVGTPIRAAFAGTVEKVGWNVVSGRSGQGILIKNSDGERQYYGHLSSVSVKAGDKVALGQVIGHMGATGNVTGSHLHFEVWDKKSKTMNPRIAFKAHKVTPGLPNTGGAVSAPPPKPVNPPIPPNKVTPKPTPIPYYNRAIDGNPGKYTWTALQEFLKDKGYYKRVVDGNPGKYTWTALQQFLADRDLYNRAIDGDAGHYTIVGLQTFLNKNGFYSRAIDGKVGKHTWSGLQTYLSRRTKA